MIEIPPHLSCFVFWLSLVVGLVFGSFLNVVGHRLLAESARLEAELLAAEEKAKAGESEAPPTGASEKQPGWLQSIWECVVDLVKMVSYPPSHCPKCETPIKPYDNIPVISYLILGGKCRHCKVPISIQYPLFELATGLLFAFTVQTFGVSWQTLFLLFLICNLVVITITDLRESYIFQINSLSLIPVGLLYNILGLSHGTSSPVPGSGIDIGGFTIDQAVISAVLGIFLAFIFFEGMILLSESVFGTEGFGHGDTHLMMGVGAYLGWELCAVSLALGFLLQSLLAIPMLVIQWIQNKNYPSLISGGASCLFGILPLFILNVPQDSPLFPYTSPITLGCIVATLIALFFFMRQIRNNQTYTYVPLGPALVLGTLISLFWGQPILKAIGSVYGH
jgi:leader peptidase (prepilin peptidase)/N-methyltransferase